MGVKSLWTLLAPVGRPLPLETMEGKSMAIDSSIWLYQFQATMRDKEGRLLVNAHILGFLRRICKLLYHGIQPVFVFDGGAPALKRSTIINRKKKKSGAAASHAKLAEKLLAAKLRREAVSRGLETSPQKPKEDDNAVYLEDLIPSAVNNKNNSPVKPVSEVGSTPLTSPQKKYRDYDPYKLPELDMEEIVTKATSSAAPDPRLATEDELRAFIEEMKPEDIDVTSPAFRDLPTEVQYEIIGDLRLKSRQTSYARLQNMLDNAPTPLDFSKQQIQNLKQRNQLTQQLLTSNDEIGKAQITIPVRIASERNKQYVLVKNDGADGGWILGIRDGTKANPIEIDHDSVKEDPSSDMEMEEVSIPNAPETPDPDLAEFHRGNALRSRQPSSIAGLLKPKRYPVNEQTIVLDEELGLQQLADELGDEDEDEQLALAIQQSLDHRQRSITPDAAYFPQIVLQVEPDSHSRIEATQFDTEPITESAPSVEAPVHSHSPPPPSRDLIESSFGTPRLLLHSTPNTAKARSPPKSHTSPVLDASFGTPRLLQQTTKETSPLRFRAPSPTNEKSRDQSPIEIVESPTRSKVISNTHSPAPRTPLVIDNDSDTEVEMEEVLPTFTDQSPETPFVQIIEKFPSNNFALNDEEVSLDDNVTEAKLNSDVELEQHRSSSHPLTVNWSRSASPEGDAEEATQVQEEPEHWDAAQEMDIAAEQGEFARFASNMRGRDLGEVRKELDAEIESLNQQRRNAMRDSEDVTQQMVNQIMMMLRLFGIPYITAPMEAEAQCAELATLGLVDGIITDDSDVFLFGGLRVFKNMFNQSKTVECFLSVDLTRELGLDRDTLIRLAYLLGSDYVEGLPGVGPVVAMELLKEFPGEDGLHTFRAWWSKVQTGKDTEEDTSTKFRKRFKRKFKDLYLSTDWPNTAVKDAYYHPVVDDSDEPFKWGLPDLDALRSFFREELGWNQSKVDELLLPLIQRIRSRGQTNAMNKQGNLNTYFDVAAGSGTSAPKKRHAYSSKRLQEVVKSFRKEKANAEGREASMSDSDGDGDDAGRSKKKARKTGGATKTTKRKTKPGSSAAKRGGGSRGGRGKRKPATTGQKRARELSDDEAEDGETQGDFEEKAKEIVEPMTKTLRPRPKPTFKGKKQRESASESEPEINSD